MKSKQLPKPHSSRPGTQPRRKAPTAGLPSPSSNRSGYWIMGRNAVGELLNAAPDRVQEIWCTTETSPLLENRSYKGPLHRGVDRHQLTALVGSDSHQGIVAWASPRETLSLDELLEAIPADAPSLILLPDGINDPQNLGAIIRAAECFGADGMILNRNRGCTITPVVTKSAVGATELVPIIEVSNADQAVRVCQKHHYWAVAAALDSRSQALAAFSFPARTLLIVGSEGDGVQPLLLKRSDHLVAIEQYGVIDSLNVSQATAILCHQYRQAHPAAINASLSQSPFQGPTSRQTGPR